jgi:midasin (ATPase involved in ribosome maturation)
LLVQPTIEQGVIRYKDAPLITAMKYGHVAVIDEADKAPVHVISILKSIAESSELILPDGRRVCHTNDISDDTTFVPVHPVS